MKGGAQERGEGAGAGAMVMIPIKTNSSSSSSNNNFMSDLLKKIKEIEDGIEGYRRWLCKQSLPVEAAVVTTTNVIGGAAVGAFLGSLPNNNPVLSVFRGGRLLQARDIAVMKGVEACVSCVMKRIKGQRKEDLQTSMVAAFGSGVVLSLVTDMGRPYAAVNVVGTGVLFALANVGFFQLKQKSSPPPMERTRTRCMLLHLGLQNYEKHFDKGLLTLSTISMITYRQVLSREHDKMSSRSSQR